VNWVAASGAIHVTKDNKGTMYASESLNNDWLLEIKPKGDTFDSGWNVTRLGAPGDDGFEYPYAMLWIPSDEEDSDGFVYFTTTVGLM
jgi:hypothetical protein